jgi:hypothetical protein
MSVRRTISEPLDSQTLREAADQLIYHRVQTELWSNSPRPSSSGSLSPATTAGLSPSRLFGRNPTSRIEPASPSSGGTAFSAKMNRIARVAKNANVNDLMTPLDEIPHCERTMRLVDVAKLLVQSGNTSMITADSIGLVTFEDLLHAYELGVPPSTTVEWITGHANMPVGIPAHRFIKNTASRKAAVAQLEAGDTNHLVVVTHKPKSWVLGLTPEDADVVGVISGLDLLSPADVPKNGLGAVVMV